MGFNIKETSKTQKFYWKKDRVGAYEVPDRLKKYVGNQRLEVVRIPSSENPHGNDIIFQSEFAGDNQFEELYVNVRVASDSDKFIKIPAYSIEERNEMIEKADMDLKKAQSKVEHMKSMLVEAQ